MHIYFWCKSIAINNTGCMYVCLSICLLRCQKLKSWLNIIVITCWLQLWLRCPVTIMQYIIYFWFVDDVMFSQLIYCFSCLLFFYGIGHMSHCIGIVIMSTVLQHVLINFQHICEGVACHLTVIVAADVWEWEQILLSTVALCKATYRIM